MKKLFCIGIFCIVAFFYGQEASAEKEINSISVDVKDFKLPSFPALMILGKSSSDIEVIDVSKRFDFSSFNLGNNAVEYRPIHVQEKTYLNTFYNIKKEKETYKNGSPFRNWKYFTLSLANTVTDSLSSIGFGINLNLMSVNNIKAYNSAITELNTSYKKREQYVSSEIDKLEKQRNQNKKLLIAYKNNLPEFANTLNLILEEENFRKSFYSQLPNLQCMYNVFEGKNFSFNSLSKACQDSIKEHIADIVWITTKVNKELSKADRTKYRVKYDSINASQNNSIKKKLNRVLSQPQFSWDLSSAYRLNFLENEIKQSQPSGFGIWSSFKFQALSDFEENNCLNIYGYGRFFKNWNTIINEIKEDPDYFDVGFKLELYKKNISIAVEYINRLKTEDYKLTGILQYVINNNTYLVGSFGKSIDFQADLLSLIGIKWGLVNEKQLQIQ